MSADPLLDVPSPLDTADRLRTATIRRIGIMISNTHTLRARRAHHEHDERSGGIQA